MRIRQLARRCSNGYGRLEAVQECAWALISLLVVRGPSCMPLLLPIDSPVHCSANGVDDLVMKEMFYSIYTDFETYLDESFAGNVDQTDAFSSIPAAGIIPLKFRRLR